MNIDEKLMNEVVKWRHHLHQYPEISYNEYKTTEYIHELLSSFEGMEVSRPTETGVLGVLKGAKSSNDSKVILFRADIDALPIQEETDLEFKSKNDGVMHACGHDCHASMLLGAAKALSENRNELSGEIRFMFQHAEEMVPGGSIEFINAGALKDVDYAFALHVDPYTDVGKFQLKYGVALGTADDFKVKIIGEGSHASQPENSIDTITISAEIISNLQYIVSRKISPFNAPVVSVTRIHGGEALNVLPSTVEFGGTIRSVHDESRKTAQEQVEKIINGICETHGASYEIDWDIGYPSVTNEATAVDYSKDSMENTVGKENIIFPENPLLGTEDFANISQVVPSSMQLIGAYDETLGEQYPLHHPKIKIPDATLEYGVKYFVGIAKKIML